MVPMVIHPTDGADDYYGGTSSPTLSSSSNRHPNPQRQRRHLRCSFRVGERPVTFLGDFVGFMSGETPTDQTVPAAPRLLTLTVRVQVDGFFCNIPRNLRQYHWSTNILSVHLVPVVIFQLFLRAFTTAIHDHVCTNGVYGP